MEMQTAHPEWMNDELVRDIDPRKLELILQINNQVQGKSQKDTLRTLLPLLKEAKKQNLTFTPAEMQAAIQAMQKHSTESEKEKMAEILEKAKEKGMPTI